MRETEKLKMKDSDSLFIYDHNPNNNCSLEGSKDEIFKFSNADKITPNKFLKDGNIEKLQSTSIKESKANQKGTFVENETGFNDWGFVHKLFF